MALPSWLELSPNLRARVLTALVLAPIVLLIVGLGGWVYNALVIFAAVVISTEWMGITSSDAASLRTEEELKKWRVSGMVYATVFGTSLVYLRAVEGGLAMLFYLLFIVWSMDIGAYFAGRFIGGPKIAPSISPKKTWAGLLGGMFACAIVGLVFSFFSISIGIFQMVLVSVSLGVVSQMGDFLESWVKRRFDVKDSGTMLPGHGGIMDRVDSLVTATPYLVIISVIHGGGFFS